MMSGYAHISSIQLFNILDHTFETDDIVRYRRLSIPYKTENGIGTHCIGSRSDGFNLQGSDVDIMSVLERFVVEDLNISVVQNKKICPLHTVYDYKSSGYVCLELYMQLNVNDDVDKFLKIVIHNCIIFYKDRWILSSMLFLNYFNKIFMRSVNGPSITNLKCLPIDTDNVFAFKCKSWPLIASEWLIRNRKLSWPSKTVIELIKSHGCHFVPIGEHNSSIKELQWRVSFVLSERMLVGTFNNVQFKVYGLLKLIKSEVLCRYKQNNDNENLINSYHMKTIMFWIIENTPEHMWIPQRLVFCLRLCLRYLKHFVEISFLPNYFLPVVNLFKKHANSDMNGLITTLDIFIKHPLTIVSGLTSLQYSISFIFKVMRWH